MDLPQLSLYNPTLHYKLDPGEPGLLSRAKASESQMAVTAQEHHNLVRLLSEAYREGRIPIDYGITYVRGIEGNFAVIRAGQTHVRSIKKEDNNIFSDLGNEPTNTPDPSSSESLYFQEKSSSQIEREELSLTARKARLKALIDQTRMRIQGTDNLAMRNLQIQRLQQYEYQLERVEQEISDLKRKRISSDTGMNDYQLPDSRFDSLLQPISSPSVPGVLAPTVNIPDIFDLSRFSEPDIGERINIYY